MLVEVTVEKKIEHRRDLIPRQFFQYFGERWKSTWTSFPRGYRLEKSDCDIRIGSIFHWKFKEFYKFRRNQANHGPDPHKRKANLKKLLALDLVEGIGT
ncbi:unnamed protein product [Caenorhabditis angaria]|uniref:Uncharacterized protein n=1 Tax=Caenorhabditis angaria TaxID=860376 RepID=A0A9P1IMT9_9PELO|nr:unnamed protein product [Caenorhabditis angaria]